MWQSEVVPQLVADTDGRLQVLTLFKALCRRHPGRFQGLGAAVRIEDFEDFGTTTNGLSLPRVSRNRAGVRSVGCHFGCQFGPVDVTEILSDQMLSAFISRGLIPACREETVRRQGAFRRSSSGLSCTAAWRIVATAYRTRPSSEAVESESFPIQK